LLKEDKVICILASLPEGYDVFVTQECFKDCPTPNIVIERLFREEEKLKGREPTEEESKLLVSHKL